MDTTFRLIMTNASGGSWIAYADTLLDAHKQMQHMLESWDADKISEFEIFEDCSVCNGSGRVKKGNIKREVPDWRSDCFKKCTQCKGLLSNRILHYQELCKVIRQSRQFITLEERRMSTAK